MEHYDEVGIAVHEKLEYVIMKVEKYDKLPEYELGKASTEARQNIKERR